MTADARLTIPTRDGYAQYYAEKLWSWVPEVYRTLDADPPANGVLRAMIELVAEEAAILRRDIDRLWDDQAIELCDDWAVAYLGALVGASPLSTVNARGNRLAAGKAIAYQRRKGTPAVIQMAIRDIAGVEGVVVEAFRRLSRFPHRLDIDSIAIGGVTSTPDGGFANLHSPRISGLIDTAFDETAHFPDPRRLRGPYGRYGLRKVNLHLYPYRSAQIDLPTPVQIGSGRFTLDPSGRDVPLFQRGQTSDRPPDQVREVDLPEAIVCRRLNASRHQITAAALAVINDPGLDTALAPLLDVTFNSAASFRRNVGARLTAAQRAAFFGPLLDATLLPDSPKAVLWGDSLSLTNSAESVDPDLPPSAVVAANLDDWQAGLVLEPHVAVAFDPDTGRTIPGQALAAAPLFVDRLHIGLFDVMGAIGLRHNATALPIADSVLPAGPTGPNGGFTGVGPVAVTLPAPLIGVHRFATSRTYEPTLPGNRNYAGITKTRLDAADGARPFVRFRPDAATLDITFTAAAPVAGETRTLEIDGLWIELLAANIVPEVLADAADSATPIVARIILDGRFDAVTLRQVTLDPGGERARATPLQAVAIPTVRLEIEGQVDRLLLDRCITGPVWETNNDPALCNPGQMEICDSIVQSIVPGDAAIQTRLAHVKLVRSTVFGRVEVARLYASDSLIVGRTRVTDSQHGCFRYSSTAKPGAVLPPQFESFVPDELPADWFRSRRFGDPDFAVLSPTAPEAIAKGGENHAEMGVFNARALSVLLADLARQVVDLLPVGQTPQYIIEHAVSPTEDRP
jgi:hypothetical protein